MKPVQGRKCIYDLERSQSQEPNTKDESRNSVSRPGSDEEYEDDNIELEYEEPETDTSKEVSKLNTAPAPKVASLLWKFIPVVILIAFAIFIKLGHTEKQICSFENLQNEYLKESDSTWKKLQAGVEIVLNKIIEKPVVFLLLHHGSSNSFTLIKKLAQHSSKCFGKDLMPINSVDFTGASLDDYGYVIEKYKSKIKEGDVVLIANLNEIPAHAARALHSICDTYSPIRKNVVIFLTLTTQENKKGNANFLAEETLRELWGSKLNYNELDPLITRVTDEVIILES